ncbi:dnaJ domain-containing protein [Ditylenchus destructor]|nr:dnaJ domain-containing protein [Ditylenchus destructor]
MPYLDKLYPTLHYYDINTDGRTPEVDKMANQIMNYDLLQNLREIGSSPHLMIAEKITSLNQLRVIHQLDAKNPEEVEKIVNNYAYDHKIQRASTTSPISARAKEKSQTANVKPNAPKRSASEPSPLKTGSNGGANAGGQAPKQAPKRSASESPPSPPKARTDGGANAGGQAPKPAHYSSASEYARKLECERNARAKAKQTAGSKSKDPNISEVQNETPPENKKTLYDLAGNFYDILGLELDATVEAVKQRLRKIYLKVHPDKLQDNDPIKAQQNAEERNKFPLDFANYRLIEEIMKKCKDQYDSCILKMHFKLPNHTSLLDCNTKYIKPVNNSTNCPE